ncbi:hypothetical protein [Planomonospora sp. ID82291]|uniref:hypothetical protein n=1 Tax=Planomonospora sp. ID82291 TaxID=2738136 RepID=UPI0018C3BC3B|nr:hypothetical protein [Planomonospora sp. ID82291]MBG0816092.1 hypothetical protein [Planomonospora sp. ID82291]
MLRVAALTLVALLTACSTSRDEEMFHIVNGTQDTVTVQWKRDTNPFATFAPGEGIDISVPAERCNHPPADDTLIARSASGRSYSYGPPICYGEIWEISD